MSGDAMLEVEGLVTFYGRAQILFDLAIGVAEGEVLVLMGRNGAGKSTTLKSIMGLVRPAAGSVRFRGRELTGLPPFRIARSGVGYVPEERRIFAELTVEENLEVGRRDAPPGKEPWTPSRLYALFPNLAELRRRRADRISGGEQQMLAIARTLMGNPELLLLDEPSEGLAPVIVDQMVAALTDLRRHGVSILLSEQNLHFAGRIAERACIIEKGQIRWRGTMQALLADEEVRRAYLSV